MFSNANFEIHLVWAAQVGVNPLYKNDLGYAAIPM